MADTIERQRFEEVYARVLAAASRSPFRQRVTVVGVSKKQPAAVIEQYLSWIKERGGIAVLGENYVQEWAEKRSALQGSYSSHLIGPLQSNKTPRAVELFDVIESVHTEKIAGLLSREAEKRSKLQEVFLQVNVSSDPAKAGFEPRSLLAAWRSFQALSGLSVKGIMTITREYDRPEDARPDFRKLRILRDELDPGLSLSMGMSADFEIAIEEGATHVRIGTALFGARPTEDLSASLA